MQQTKQLVIKTITGALEDNVVATNRAVLEFMPLIGGIMNTVGFSSGNTLYPFTDTPTAGQTSFVVGGLAISKTIDVTVLEMTDETYEDINPKVGINECMTTLMAQSIAKKVEKQFVDDIKADGSLPTTPAGATPSWNGIANVIQDMGSSIFNTKGKYCVGVSLKSYLAIIGDSGYKDAKLTLGDKISVVVSEDLLDTEMIIFHTHGVAGGFQMRNLEFDREATPNRTAFVGSFNKGHAYDNKYIRFVS